MLKLNKIYKLDWEKLSKDAEDDVTKIVPAIGYLLQAMDIKINEKIYQEIPDKGKRYFVESPLRGEELTRDNK